MKKMAKILLVTIVLLSVLVTSASASTYYVTGDGVRVRSEPKNADNIIGKLKYGQKVEVTASKGGWCQIEYGDGYGYITDSFLAKSLDLKEKPEALGLTKKEVSLKKNPSESAKTITKIPSYNIVVVYESKDGWSAVDFNGKKGFVKANSLTIKSTGNLTYLGGYTITFHQNDPTRTTNIKKAVKELNGTTVKSGAKFSFFQVVGVDYIEATEFYEDDVQYGGGLSHIATTLNKAINDAQHHGCNIAVKEKHRFSKKTPYAKKGEEAMVSISDKMDFVFKNKNDYSIKIYAMPKNDSIIVMLFKK
ncbi:MAG: VanW family protein [Clostridia bacterium]|nr:VanW family protein [Clostridia bacterium]